MERYHSFPAWCRKTFGRKLWRVALDAGMTCPNRDGTIGTRGCIFCDEGGSGDFAIAWHGQKLSREEFLYNHHEGQPGDFIAYFQAYTNTYAPVERLRMLFERALEDDLFAGISIATRPDCLETDVCALLKELKEKFPQKFIWCELGLQSIHEASARFIRRGYPLGVYDEAVQNLHAIGIPVITHVILGLPGEGKKEMLETIEHLNEVQTDGVKLQLLHYLSGTDLGVLYQKNPASFHVLSEEEYVELVAECIGHLDPSIVINRLTGDGNPELLLAPEWSLHKRRVLNEIGHALKERNIVQGCLKGEINHE
jgi:radical SAM protein (TIGR01212 family)